MYKLLHQVNYVYMILQLLKIVICAICARTSCKENIYTCFSGEKPSINRETQHIICACHAHVRRWNLEFSNRGEHQIFFLL